MNACIEHWHKHVCVQCPQHIVSDGKMMMLQTPVQSPLTDHSFLFLSTFQSPLSYPLSTLHFSCLFFDEEEALKVWQELRSAVLLQILGNVDKEFRCQSLAFGIVSRAYWSESRERSSYKFYPGVRVFAYLILAMARSTVPKPSRKRSAATASTSSKAKKSGTKDRKKVTPSAKPSARPSKKQKKKEEVEQENEESEEDTAQAAFMNRVGKRQKLANHRFCV